MVDIERHRKSGWFEKTQVDSVKPGFKAILRDPLIVFSWSAIEEIQVNSHDEINVVAFDAYLDEKGRRVKGEHKSSVEIYAKDKINKYKGRLSPTSITNGLRNIKHLFTGCREWYVFNDS
jgi:hypothetical protein